MTAAAAKVSTPVLRNAAGEPPLGVGGLAFRDDQGEMFYYDRDRAPSVKIGLVELESGLWLMLHPHFATKTFTFDNRDNALIFACDAMVEKARRFMVTKEGEGTHWTQGYGERVIEWALSIKPEQSPVQVATADAEAESDHPGSVQDGRVIAGSASETSGSLNLEELTIAGYEASDAGAGLSDPVVSYLVEQHALRKQFPAKHIFSMTTEIAEGRIVSVATCACKQVFKFGSNDYLRMNAAIEAHWRRFSHEKTVDGRGEPLGEAAPVEAKKPKRKTKSKPGAGGLPAPLASATPARDLPDGADASIERRAALAAIAAGHEVDGQIVRDLVGEGLVHATATKLVLTEEGHAFLQNEVAPIGAGSTEVSEPLVTTALSSAEVDPVREAGLHGGSLALSDDVQTSDEFSDSPLLKAALDLAWREPPQVTASLAALLDFSKVYAAPKEVSRPLLRWHGGKWKLAPWLMGFFPDHRIYVEPFGGAGSVLMRKPRVYAEIYNDLDDVVVNLFRVLRDEGKAARLIEALRLTPFARGEFTDALLEAEDDVERARHLIVRSYMGFGSNAHSGSATAEKIGFKSFTRPDEYRSTGFRANSNRSGTTPAHDWANYPDALPAIIERLSGVIVEQRPAMDVMRQHDGVTTLHYVDPPYLPETRSPANKYDLKHRMYRHELTVDDHRELLAFLRSLLGYVVLSGYPSDLYDGLLPDWRRETCVALADGARERTEVVWLNPACAAALDEKHPTLFNIAALDAANTPPLGRDGGD